MRIESYHLDGCVYVKTSELRMSISGGNGRRCRKCSASAKNLVPGACDAKIGFHIVGALRGCEMRLVSDDG